MDAVDFALLSIEPTQCKTCSKLLARIEAQSAAYAAQIAKLQSDIKWLEQENESLEAELAE